MRKKRLVWILMVIACIACLTSVVSATDDVKKYYAEGYVTLFNNNLEPIDFRQQYGALTNAPVITLGEVQKSPGAGQFSSWNYSVDVTVSTGDYARKDYPIEFDVNFSELLAKVGGGSLADNSVRLVQNSPAEGAVEVVSQFDKAEDYDAKKNASGILVWILEGETETSTNLNYTLYFDTADNGKKPVPDYQTNLVFESVSNLSGYSELKNSEIGLIIRDSNGFFEALRQYDVRTASVYWKDMVWSDLNGVWWSPVGDLGIRKVLWEGPVRVVIKGMVKSGGKGATVVKTYTVYNTGNTFKFTTLWELKGARNDPVSSMNSILLWGCNSSG